MIYISIIALLLIIRLFIDHNWIKCTTYEVSSSKVPSAFDGYKIVQLSDLHSKKFGNQIYKKIALENPDIIVMTGDMVSSNDSKFQHFFELAKKLSEKYKVFYIKGNHEGRMFQRDYNFIASTIQSYGIKVMDNECVRIEKEGEYIQLYGLWCNQRYYASSKMDEHERLTKKAMNRLLGACDQKLYNVLLMHTPLYFDVYEKWGADLILSGHIHGGMVRLPFLGGVFSPHKEWFPKYCYGKYQLNDSVMIVSSGLGRGATGFRFWNRPEIVSITLRSQK